MTTLSNFNNSCWEGAPTGTADERPSRAGPVPAPGRGLSRWGCLEKSPPQILRCYCMFSSISDLKYPVQIPLQRTTPNIEIVFSQFYT